MDLGDVYARSTPLSESHHRSLWIQQITITPTEGALLIFFALKNCYYGWGFEPTILDLSSQSDMPLIAWRQQLSKINLHKSFLDGDFKHANDIVKCENHNLFKLSRKGFFKIRK